ncbi:hypothetical protein, partial [Aneurinibacillus sp. REN35]
NKMALLLVLAIGLTFVMTACSSKETAAPSVGASEESTMEHATMGSESPPASNQPAMSPSVSPSASPSKTEGQEASA